MDEKVLISVKNLDKYFSLRKTKDCPQGLLKAVDNVSFDIYKSETFGLVGESGCGKSTLGRTILHLLKPTNGNVEFDGVDVGALNKTALKSIRRKLQIVFQDPSASLNPRKRIDQIIREPMIIHKIYDPIEREKRIDELLNVVGLGQYHKNRYPHELSGGQKQRVGIARALALNPEFIVCDEAVSALDVSVQAQVINLLHDLQQEFDLTYLFISHNLNVVYQISDRVAVMYLGKIVEIATYGELYQSSLHPYTKSLLSSIPQVGENSKCEKIILKGDVPNPANAPSGCKFHTRCPIAIEKCKAIAPELVEVSNKHFVACHRLEK
ncbi:MAG: ATP-binding cassette domain-containing protein [Tissierellales bacterium]|nr:ATP-binding cassette domain-containing protein [Tissierellales bacterium]MBN2828493.1 ATP-binding cassette domain-containing protein [Tissierellales bacterium]